MASSSNDNWLQNLVVCNCNYECNKFREGFRLVTEDARSAHIQHDAEGARNPSANRRFICYCSVCGGNAIKSKQTIYRHLKNDTDRAELRTTIPSTSIDVLDRPIIESPPNFSDETRDQIAPESLSIEDKLQFKIIKFQALLDSSNVSISNQDIMLKTLFTDIGDKNEKSDKSLVSLLRTIPRPWNGEVNGDVFPDSFYKVMKLYNKLGMIKPKCYKLCTGSSELSHDPILMQPSVEDDNSVMCSHNKIQRLCSECCSKCTMCGKFRKDILSFYYIHVGEQLKLMCRSRTICHEFLAMWRNRTNWLNKNINDYPHSINEFWDGSKLREWSAFWDPTKQYELPVTCKHCKKSYATFPESARVHQINTNWLENAQRYQFPCDSCSRMVSEEQRFVQGDPRNFALLGHWDGFQPTRTTYKNCWTLEIKILNAGKESFLAPLPVVFIPLSSTKLYKQKGTSVMNFFLKPFIDEMESLYIEGVQIKFAYDPGLISSLIIDDNPRIRAMLHVVTGDHPAQCKMANLKDGGYSCCRRCHVKQELNNNNQLVFKENYEAEYIGAASKTILELHVGLENWKKTSTDIERKNISDSIGITDESPLWRLYHLYGFDIINDLVFDVMHCLPLNIFKKYIEELLQKFGVTAAEKTIIENALSTVRNSRLKSMARRWPTNPTTRLGYFKAEEYQVYIQYCLQHTMDSLSADYDTAFFQCGLLLILLARLFYCYSRNNGWTQEMINSTRTLFQTWRRLVISYGGLNASILEHVVGSGHLMDDIKRHGPADVYWCYQFEREVSTYMQIAQNTNSYLYDFTFATNISRTLFTQTMTFVDLDQDGMYPQDRALKRLHCNLFKSKKCPHMIDLTSQCYDWHEQCAIRVNSQQTALEIWKRDVQLLSDSCVCKKLILQKGIIIGPQRLKKEVISSVQELRCLQRMWNSSIPRNPSQHVEKLLYSFRAIVWKGKLYRLNDTVVVRSDDEDKVYFGIIKKFFINVNRERVGVFFQAHYYSEIEYERRNEKVTDPQSGMTIIEEYPRIHEGDNIRPVSYLLHKFVRLPVVKNDDYRRKSYYVAYELDDLKPRFL